MVAALFLARQPQVQLHRLTHIPEPIGNRTSLEVKARMKNVLSRKLHDGFCMTGLHHGRFSLQKAPYRSHEAFPAESLIQAALSYPAQYDCI